MWEWGLIAWGGSFTELAVLPAGIQQIPNIPFLHIMGLEISC